MSDDPYERDQYLHNHRYADSPNCGERLVGNCIATPPAPTEDGWTEADIPVATHEPWDDLDERRECAVCHHWPKWRNWVNHILAYPTHWPTPPAPTEDGQPVRIYEGIGPYDRTTIPPAPTEDAWDAALADPAFRESLDEGLADVAAGRTVPHTPAPTEDATLDADIRLIRQYLTLFGGQGHDERMTLAALDRIAARVSAPITESALAERIAAAMTAMGMEGNLPNESYGREIAHRVSATEDATLDASFIEGVVSTALYEYDVDSRAAQHVMDELRAALARSAPITESALAEAMSEAYTYEDDDHAIPTLPFIDDNEGFWEPFAAAILAALRPGGAMPE